MMAGDRNQRTISGVKLALAASKVRTAGTEMPLLLSEPLAILGMGCRFPGGASTPELFWKEIIGAVDAAQEIPLDRWDINQLYDPDPASPGKMSSREGSFIEEADCFDPGFFGISPREAVGMDPQQRILLEVVWEALEDAGKVPARLAGEQVGVFVAAYNSDYARLQYSDPEQINAYTTSGTAHSIAAGRISYVFDFRGPNLTIDTACSASLVAFHLACRSLRVGECDLALTGGVSLVLGPESGISMSKWGMMAPDGRCKTFDAAANGFGRGEGCGVVVLKRLADAVRDGDRVRAIVRGTAINQDGRSSTLTAPNGLSQQDVVRAALENSRVAPVDITYVEAHGTGTKLGDPIEVEALSDVLGASAPGAAPCALGSVKANIGHLEAAAGVAGVIKTVLALEHRTIPPLAHFRLLNPHIKLEGTRLVVPTEPRSWETAGGSRFAGISSFGFGGTNAHVVLEESAELAPRARKADSRAPRLLLLSSPVESGVRAMAERYVDWLGQNAEDAPPLEDVCATSALYRTHHEHRLAVVGESGEQMVLRLQSWSRGERVPTVAAGAANGVGASKTVFVFSGQGPQWWAMGRELLEREPLFRETLERCDELIARYAGWSLLEQFQVEEGNSRLDQTEVAQPAIFALQLGLVSLWSAWGIKPDVLVGHSVGEIAAACVAKCLSLEDAVRLVVLRGRLMQRATGCGRMTSLEATPQELEEIVENFRDQVAIAAQNAPRSSVLSGDTDAIEEAVRQAELRGLHNRWLPVKYAFHSPQMVPLAEELLACLHPMRPAACTVRMVSTVTADFVSGKELSREYWAENMKRPVQFAAAIECLLKDGANTFIEIAPHPVLSASILVCAGEKATSICVAASLRRGQPERATMLAALGEIWAHGTAVDFSTLHLDAGPAVSLPAYAWQHQRYWIQPRTATRAFAAPAARDVSQQTDLLYGITWKLVPEPTVTPAKGGTWLVFTGGSPVEKQVCTLLAGCGRVVSVAPGHGFREISPRAFEVDPLQPEDFEKVLATVEQGDSPFRGAIFLWALGATFPEDADDAAIAPVEARVCGGALHLTQALSRKRVPEDFRLLFVTRGAQPVVPSDHDLALAQAPLWGFSNSVALEHPALKPRTIDLEPQTSDSDPDSIWNALFSEKEPRLAIRASCRYVQRLERKRLSAPMAAISDGTDQDTHPGKIDSEATYVIAGGTGALGVQCAQLLFELGARNLVLLSRSGPREAARQAMALLEQQGARVITLQGDMSNAEDCERILHHLGQTMPPVKGVLYVAGVVEDGTIEQQSWPSLIKVMKPKVFGPWNLLHGLDARKLDFVVFFSSVASVFGSAGQSNYALANSFLDALACDLAAQGAKSLSVNWGPWKGEGMAASLSDQDRRRLAGRGLLYMEPKVARDLLSRLLFSGGGQRIVAAIDWANAVGADGSMRLLASELKIAAAQGAAAASTESTQEVRLLEMLREASPTRRKKVLIEYLRERVARIFGLDVSAVEIARPFREIGLDSLLAVELRNVISKHLEKSLPATLLFDYPTIDVLSERLLGEVFGLKAEAKASTEPAAPEALEETTPIDKLSEQEAEALLLKELGEAVTGGPNG
jgi:myxalamid-type polyketide synthase MxaC